MKTNDQEKGRKHRSIIGLILFVMLATATMAMAAEAGKTMETGRFEVVVGNDDLAYLVDTTTGAVWVLTYRTMTMATGREPIAIPFKFILRTPKDQGDFLLESPGTTTSLPPSGGK
jgi:hypothetical protein